MYAGENNPYKYYMYYLMTGGCNEWENGEIRSCSYYNALTRHQHR